MQRYHNINGTLVPAEEASLKVNDLAIMRGFGIFDYFLVEQKVPLFLEDYLARFYRSAQQIHLKMPVTETILQNQIQELINIHPQENAAIRLILTGGYATDSYTPIEPNLLILHHDFKPAPHRYYTEGVKLLAYPYQRDLPEVKSINYSVGIRMIGRLKAAGAIELLYHWEGMVKEAVRSNFFIVNPDKTLVTPDSDVLQGITRKYVLAAAREKGLKVIERPVSMEEVRNAEEAFLTGSNKRVMPVVAIDNYVFGNGTPGPVTRQVMQVFRETVENYVNRYKVIQTNV